MSGTLQVKSQTIEIGHMQRLRSSRHPISRPTVHSHPCTLAISISHSHSTAFSSCAATEMTTDYFILNSEGESIIVFRAQSRSETYIQLNNSAASTDMMTVAEGGMAWTPQHGRACCRWRNNIIDERRQRLRSRRPRAQHGRARDGRTSAHKPLHLRLSY